MALYDDIKASLDELILNAKGEETCVIKHFVSNEAMADVLSEDSDISPDSFYSESNVAHILRGIAALDAAKGTEHELIDPDFPLAKDEIDDETFKLQIMDSLSQAKRGESRPLDEVFAELRNRVSSSDCPPSREDVLDAFHALRTQAAADFPDGLTMEEINDEINKTRNGIPD